MNNAGRALQIVIPMAGAGQRFVEAGYKVPKPLIPVSGRPMVARVIGDLPAATRIVCICQRAHEEGFGISGELKKYFPQASVVIAPGLTEGQACSVALAGPQLDPEVPVLVASCDNTHLYDAGKLASLCANPEVDALIWTYRGEPRVSIKPQQYGFVQVDGGVGGSEDDCVVRVSCKMPISATPEKDHVVSGFFWFRSARLMLEGIAELVARNIRVNNEFYMDVVPNVLIERGQRVRVFEVEKYIGWGTPADLKDYQLWERYLESI